MKRYSIKSDFYIKLSCEVEVNEKLISQVPVSLTFRKSFIVLLAAHTFDISQSECLESYILEVEVLIKHLITKSISFILGWPTLEKRPGIFR